MTSYRPIRPQSKGFALLLVLVVLAIAATVLAGLSRNSCQTALDAAAAQRRLEAKWLLRSASRQLLAQAETILVDQSGKEDKHLRTAWRTLEVGPWTLTAAVSDEQAKANVNLLSDQFGQIDLAATIRRLEAPTGRVSILLRPTSLPDPTIARSPRLYRSYDQIFVFDHPRALLDADRTTLFGGSGITCWSNGKLHVHRSDDQAIRSVLRGLVDRIVIEQLLAYRRENPDSSLTELLESLDLGDNGPLLRAKLRLGLTETSRSHSLWLSLSGTTSSHLLFAIDQQADGAHDAIRRSFTWSN